MRATACCKLQMLGCVLCAGKLVLTGCDVGCREAPPGREGQPFQQVPEGEARFRGDRPDRGRGRNARGRGARYSPFHLPYEKGNMLSYLCYML